MLAFGIIIAVLAYFFIAFLSYHYCVSKGIGVEEKVYSNVKDTSFTALMAVFWPVAMPIYAMYKLAENVLKTIENKGGKE
jgi:hypothetical protein